MAKFDEQLLSAYVPRELDIVCRRCKRSASVSTNVLRGKYGDRPLAEIAQLVAADGVQACQLAAMGGGCSVRPEEPPFEQWATLTDAAVGRWVGYLNCDRRHAGLKSTKPCPGIFAVDVETLLMVLPYDFPMADLRRKLTCPLCKSTHIELRWQQLAPPPRNTPAAARSSGGMGRGGLRLVKKAG